MLSNVCSYDQISILGHRIRLAALHFNENSSRDQAQTKAGERRFDLIFPKYKKGGHIHQTFTTKHRAPPVDLGECIAYLLITTIRLLLCAGPFCSRVGLLRFIWGGCNPLNPSLDPPLI